MNTTNSLWLKLILQSDAALGRGDGVAGMVNSEIKHDPMGLPYFSGKTLKGLLVAQCAEILYSLEKISKEQTGKWEKVAQSLFGGPGSRQSEAGKLRVEDACLPPDLRAVMQNEFHRIEMIWDTRERQKKWGLKRAANLEALTATRVQTAIDPRTGAPLRNSLRTIRVVLRTTPFIARLEVKGEFDNLEKALLAACVYALRRMGSGRNRGLGTVEATLFEDPLFDPETNRPKDVQPVTKTWFEAFEKEVL